MADFVSRFMGNEEANKTFKDNKQRAAVAYQTYRDWKRKQRRTKNFEDDSIIPEVYILSQGEAKGHDLYIDKTSIEQAFELMKKAPNGVKVKMNHGSGLDAVVGLARNPRIDGDKLKADLHLLKSSPHYALIKEMADEAPDQFGVSLAFINESETVDGKDYIRPQSIASADLVSSPASNERFKDFSNEDAEMLLFAVGTKLRCWEGYKPTKGVEPYAPGSCVKAETETKNSGGTTEMGYVAGGESVPSDIKQAVVESDPILDNKGKQNMDEQYKSDMDKINKRLEALEAMVAPKEEVKKEEAPVAPEAPKAEDKKDESQMGELIKKALTEFGIKPIPASPVVEEKTDKKDEVKTFEALVAAHPDYGTSKLKAIQAVMLSNPNEYAEALSRGITKI